MESPERTTSPVGGPYPEEMLLEAYDLEWEAIELRRQRLQKTWQHFQIISDMEVEDLQYQRKLLRLKYLERQEKEKQAQEALQRAKEKKAALIKEKERRELAEQEELRRKKEKAALKEKERQEVAEKEDRRRKKEKEAAIVKERQELVEKEARRRKKEEKAALKEKERHELAEKEVRRRKKEKEAAIVKEKERLKAEKRRLKAEKKKREQEAASDTETDEEVKEIVKPKTVKSKVVKPKKQSEQPKKTKSAPSKRITPVNLPPAPDPEDNASFSEENHMEYDGYDSPPPELPDDGLLDMLSLDKSSDSDVDDEPSMVSLILPVAQNSPKRVQPSPSKKKMTPQKRFAKQKGGPPLDFDFTNAEAKRQAKAAEAAEQDEADEDDSEPEPMPAPSILTPKKRLKRRKDVAMEKAATRAAYGGNKLMEAMANSKIAVKTKKSVMVDKAKATAGNNVRKKTGGNIATAKNGKAKPHTMETEMMEEEIPTTPIVKKKARGNGEKLTIKQRLANAELLARLNKMQDVNTPKVLGKKTMKAQKKPAAKALAAKRAEFQQALASEPAEADVPRRNQDIEDGDLNISLNSSGLISDNDSTENLRASTRKRPREAIDGDVTPTKKLQFLEITKRLVKSPMPRYLRTPTPLMSPVVSSAFVKPRAASPAPRMANSRTSEAVKDSTRRTLKSAPVRPKKTSNVNKFGAPAGGTSTAASGGGFSMFDAFVNSGSSGAIPRLKTTLKDV